MKVLVDKLLASGFKLELPREDGSTHELTIETAVDLRGTYEQYPSRLRLHEVRAEEIDLAHVLWHLARGQITSKGRAVLRDLAVDLDIARGKVEGRRRMVGRIAFSRGHLADVRVELGDDGIGAEIEATGLEYRQERNHGPTIVADQIVARALRAALKGSGVTAGAVEVSSLRASMEGGLEAEASNVRAQSVDATFAAGRLFIEHVVVSRFHLHQRPGESPEIEVGDVELRGVDLRVGGTYVRVERAVLARGTRWRAGALAFSRLDLDVAQVTVDGVAKAPSKSEATPRRSHARRQVDLSFLTHLDGQLDIDLTVDAKVPFIRRRVATHHFRIPIRNGTINYKELEHDLSMLEDALIDFEVRGSRLVLEVNVPLLPVGRKTLVYWPLEGDELAMAARKIVRLDRLLSPKLPDGKARAASGDSSFELTRLDFDPIKAELRLGGPGELDLGDRGSIRLGATRKAAIGALQLDGALYHRSGGSKDRTELRASASEIRVGLDGLRVGGFRLDIDELTVGSIEEAVVVTEGLQPLSARATLRQATLRDVALRLPARTKR